MSLPTLHRPRLLPLTIIVLTALLGLKSVVLVRAAMAGGSTSSAAANAGSLTVAMLASAQAAEPPAGEAEKPAAAKPQAGKADAAAATPAAPAPPEMIPIGSPPVSDTERELLQELRARRADLDKRDAALHEREGVLAASEQRLTARVNELMALQGKLEALEKARQERDEANWKGLVKVYETMRPRDAATIFNELDFKILLQVSDRMKESKLAPVLAAMQPDKARQLTAGLADMRSKAATVGG
jgi:flagellar motility protein MotE (MotC chaperone)